MFEVDSDCFRCSHCGGLPDAGMDANLVSLLNEIPDLTEDDINCGYRCPDHNADVGGVPNSQHVTGQAADIDASKFGVEPLAKLCESLGADGVGRYGLDDGLFVHVDVRAGRTGGEFRW